MHAYLDSDVGILELGSQPSLQRIGSQLVLLDRDWNRVRHDERARCLDTAAGSRNSRRERGVCQFRAL